MGGERGGAGRDVVDPEADVVEPLAVLGEVLRDRALVVERLDQLDEDVAAIEVGQPHVRALDLLAADDLEPEPAAEVTRARPRCRGRRSRRGRAGEIGGHAPREALDLAPRPLRRRPLSVVQRDQPLPSQGLIERPLGGVQVGLAQLEVDVDLA